MEYRPRWYQDEAHQAPFDYFATHKEGNPLIAMPTGCHAKGARILMFDGSVKHVEDVIVGDRLMGPDSTSRTVLELARGREEMFRVIPNKGDPFAVNKGHILSLVKTNEGKKNTAAHRRIVNVCLKDYVIGSSWSKHLLKLRRVGVSFCGEQSFPVDPYFLGLFLGGGNFIQGNVSITSADSEILEFCKKYIKEFGDEAVITGTKSKAFTVSAKALVRVVRRGAKIADALTNLGLREHRSDTKFIPSAYTVANEQDRLALLAGLIDSDGHFSCGGFEYVTLSQKLAEGVLFVARSLGFAAYSSLSQNRFQRIFISGDVSRIPTKLPRKKAPERGQKKDVLVTGFKLESLPEDDYFGFELDGDHLYLTDDFTVHHNTGKSYSIARFIETVIKRWPGQRIMMSAPASELIRQNASKLLDLWPGAPMGIYSASLKIRQTSMPISYVQVQSAVNDIDAFGKQDLLLIDEAQLVSEEEDSRYQRLIARLREKNKKLRVIGYSASPYRLGLGTLLNGSIFTDICYDITGKEAFNRLIDEGYLASLRPFKTDTILDLSGVKKSGGEYNQKQAQEAVNTETITRAAVQESIERAHDRRSWLVFTQGVEHAESVAHMYRMYGQNAWAIHSKMDADEVKRRIISFKLGQIKILVNANMLTTGFDSPMIDCIVMLRATTSTGLWVQMLGRGTRPLYAPGYDIEDFQSRMLAIQLGGKFDCLVLDFANNAATLGPINDPRIPKKRGEGGGGDMPIKFCEEGKIVPVDGRVPCGFWNHASARHCANCAAEFMITPKITEVSSEQALIARDEEPVYVNYVVDRVEYSKWRKTGAPDSIQVAYYCGLLRFSEWVSLESVKASYLARRWWRTRFMLNSDAPCPETTDEAYPWIDKARVPVKIRVHVNRRYPVIVDYLFKEQLEGLKNGNGGTSL